MSNQDQLWIFSLVFAGGASFLIWSGWLLFGAFQRWMKDE
jgi:hypothetical protein